MNTHFLLGAGRGNGKHEKETRVSFPGLEALGYTLRPTLRLRSGQAEWQRLLKQPEPRHGGACKRNVHPGQGPAQANAVGRAAGRGTAL